MLDLPVGERPVGSVALLPPPLLQRLLRADAPAADALPALPRLLLHGAPRQGGGRGGRRELGLGLGVGPPRLGPRRAAPRGARPPGRRRGSWSWRRCASSVRRISSPATSGAAARSSRRCFRMRTSRMCRLAQTHYLVQDWSKRRRMRTRASASCWRGCATSRTGASPASHTSRSSLAYSPSTWSLQVTMEQSMVTSPTWRSALCLFCSNEMWNPGAPSTCL
mmetsp:Transcript_103184/g.250592  ORF Transcript_103184/g.250592 Transcript_103184/m.250592 type:complete len:222 (-) Transcript_103184:36-701(-)